MASSTLSDAEIPGGRRHSLTGAPVQRWRWCRGGDPTRHRPLSTSVQPEGHSPPSRSRADAELKYWKILRKIRSGPRRAAELSAEVQALVIGSADQVGTRSLTSGVCLAASPLRALAEMDHGGVGVALVLPGQHPLGVAAHRFGGAFEHQAGSSRPRHRLPAPRSAQPPDRTIVQVEEIEALFAVGGLEVRGLACVVVRRAQARVSTPRPGLSTLAPVAPRSAETIGANGPANTREKRGS